MMECGHVTTSCICNNSIVCGPLAYRLGAVRAKRAATRGVWGHAPPRKFLNFRRSVIDSGAFWDTSSMARHAYKLQSLLLICYATHLVRTRRTIDRTPPKSRSHIGRSLVQQCRTPSLRTSGRDRSRGLFRLRSRSVQRSCAAA